MIEILKEQLIRHEGLELKVYTDSVGIPTIGVGRNLKDHGITRDEAMYLLDNDIKMVINQAEVFYPWYPQLNEARKIVILNMMFNMGVLGVAGFKNMIFAVQMEDYNKAADEMSSSKWSRQVGERAVELAHIMRVGKID